MRATSVFSYARIDSRFVLSVWLTFTHSRVASTSCDSALNPSKAENFAPNRPAAFAIFPLFLTLAMVDHRSILDPHICALVGDSTVFVDHRHCGDVPDRHR